MQVGSLRPGQVRQVATVTPSQPGPKSRIMRAATDRVAKAGLSSGAYTLGTLSMGKKNSIQIRQAQLKYRSVVPQWTETETDRSV
jgi:hypothetical protein